MNCVLVIEKDGSVRQRVSRMIRRMELSFICMIRNRRIVWESVEGRHYTDSIAI